jgi:ATP-dependent RNA helicase DeaD
MVATDVASRGLDFSHVSHVINYDYPYGQESYTHRTGRTGRMGRSGIAMTFVTRQDLGILKSLFQMNRIDPVWHGTIPNLQAVLKPNKKRGSHKYLKGSSNHRTMNSRPDRSHHRIGQTIS